MFDRLTDTFACTTQHEDHVALVNMVGKILRDYRHVYIHSYGESILHVMQGVLQQLMNVNEPKINLSLGTMKASFLSSCAHNRAFPYRKLENETFALF